MRRSSILAVALMIAGGAVLGSAAMSGFASTSEATARKGVTRPLATAAGAKLAFSTKRLRVPAGRVTLKLLNRGEIGHNIALRGRRLPARKGPVVGRGRISKIVVKLKPGTYRFYCSVFGHESGGMRGTLKVRAR